MMNFLKDWIIQYQNKYLVGGVETTIDRITGTVSQEGDTISAAYLNEIQKNCIYQVNATRVIEGALEIYDITIDGSEEFTPFNQTFLVEFDTTNTKTDSRLRFNGNTYSLRFSDSITNGDIALKIGFIPKRALVKLDVANSKAIIIDFNPNNFISPEFIGVPKAPTATVGTGTTQIATTAFATGQDLGIGQTPTIVTSSRAIGQIYTNTTSKPIFISINFNAQSLTGTLKVNNVVVKTSPADTNRYFWDYIVPAGATYVFIGANFIEWVELR